MSMTGVWRAKSVNICHTQDQILNHASNYLVVLMAENEAQRDIITPRFDDEFRRIQVI